ncbi:MAG: YceH family protein [Planctomycetota bacterium]
MSEAESNELSSQPNRTLSSTARRVLGVLVEKAKTTPDSYPLSVSGIVTASNQKSARNPVMKITEDDALMALDELRAAGAAREVHGSGRVVKYRHAAYEWFDIEAAESAIITELLLRGPQTAGELRSRASRMHSFSDLDAVMDVLGILRNKKLAEPLTPPGRGQVFAHSMYPPNERMHLNAKVEKMGLGEAAPIEVTSSASSANQDAIDKLIARLDTVTDRIDHLEARLKSLES